MDKYKLVIGDEWESEIKKTVRKADAFVVCLRPGFNEVGFRQKEVRWARKRKTRAGKLFSARTEDRIKLEK